MPVDREAEIKRTAAQIADYTRLEFMLRRRGDVRGIRTAKEVAQMKDMERRIDRAIAGRIRTMLKRIGNAR